MKLKLRRSAGVFKLFNYDPRFHIRVNCAVILIDAFLVKNILKRLALKQSLAIKQPNITSNRMGGGIVIFPNYFRAGINNYFIISKTKSFYFYKNCAKRRLLC